MHVLFFQDQSLPPLLVTITTAKQEQEVVLVILLTHCGMVQVVPLTIHVVPTLTNHQLSGMTRDDIEVRICRNNYFFRDGILVDIVEIYIQ